MERTTRFREPSQSRRQFIKSSTAGVLGAIGQGEVAAGKGLLHVGLVGCGGRGAGAVGNALRADANTKLVALGDAFEDQARSALSALKATDVADRVAVDEEHIFTGFDNYQAVIASCDVVLLATPPHFRPAQLRAAIEAGKHCFVEKPVAVDGPGVRSVLESCRLAERKGLSVVSGLCWRYHTGLREAFDRVHGGAIGDLVTLECSYNTGGVWEPNDGMSYHKPRQECGSDMEHQIRNWYYYSWLSGDFNVEQHVHSLDKMQWAMHDEPPVRATGVGGRQLRTAPNYGNIYDHFSVVYEYAGGVKAFSRCRHWRGCSNDVSDHLFGTKGTCHIDRKQLRIQGEGNWHYGMRGKDGRRGRIDMLQLEHDALFASIRSGEPINNGEYMSRSTLMAIMGRMSAYTGKAITWDEALHSKERLGPSEYTWGPLEVAPVAVPGVTSVV